MKTLTSDEIVNNFTKILELVKSGERIVIINVKTKEKLAVIIPYGKPLEKKNNSKNKPERVLGVLKSKASFKIKEDFKITDEELLTL